VSEYHEDFDSIVMKLNLSDEYMLGYFLGGFKIEIHMLVRIFQPTTVRRTFTLARMYEAANSPSIHSSVLPKASEKKS